ncbi:MAG: aspartyl-tRNA(Asn)/glutamyl-tRNA(Gln) amidotransferase subunit A [Candidatus Poriferisodalaceae bacterium]|jgi:aspartyl-tRNA(Asn)/glutamyl-tRNA(Gln) amidotransferase subunit A
MSTTPWTIEGAGIALRAGETTSEQLVTDMFEASDRLDEPLGTYIARFDEPAIAAARKADAELAAGIDRGPLHGIPLGIKDIIATDEGPTTAQSLTLPPEWGDQGDGPLITRLRDAGSVLMGKTTTMEYAIGRPDFAKPFPIPRNPWNTDRWTGGSSSGTANGVASGQFIGGLGTDTGGSVRLPAAYCGISGHKPTFGLVPKSGCVPLGLSYDHIGPMTRTARDCAAMLTVMAGADPSDRTTAQRPAENYLVDIDRGLEGLRIGVIANQAIADSTSEEMLAVFDEATSALATGGADITNFEVPLYRALAEGAFLALQAEAFAWHRNLLRDRWDDYGRPTRLTIAQGALISAGDLVQVERVRQVARRQVLAAMDAATVDLLISPTTGYAASPFTGADPRATSMAAIHTPAWNSTGFPALSVPMGFDQDGLPCGLQIIGRPFADALVLAAGHGYQQQTDWHDQVAPNHASKA